MELNLGDKLGPYEIVSLIGVGGMGEVYRARDPRLGRDVAIKVSAQQFTHRFEREARATAALNHPNICTLHDVGPNYLVMELIEGPTLAERIQRGPMVLEEALCVARQIAEALEAAHGSGIVHRDLKPANIKIRLDGSVKVLDFGLAKSVEPAAVTSDSPTTTSAPGTILGTAAYMSPEQARGIKVDKRADIWAYGVVLWQMLTGRRPFEGETMSQTLAAVLTQDLDWEQLPRRTPGAIQRLLRRCLERDLRRRLPDIGSAQLEIEEALTVGPDTHTLQTVGQRHGATWAGVAALLLSAAAAGGWGWWRAMRPMPRPMVRLDVDLGPDVALPPLANSITNVIISPDGTRLIYASGAPVRLFTRRLDQSRAAELSGTDGAYAPFFSPDGKWVGFWAGKKLNKISVEGGAVVPLADISDTAGASWGADGNIIVSLNRAMGLARVPESGGAPMTILEQASGDVALVAPQILPGSKAVLFVSYKALDFKASSIDIFSFADRRRKTLVQGGTSVHYLPSGHLIYTIKGTLFAVPFDLKRLETRGAAVPVLDDVAYGPQTGFADVDYSAAGTLVYRRAGGGDDSGISTIQWVDGAGRKEPLVAKPGNYADPRLSPDGKRLALTIGEEGSHDVWVYDLERGAKMRLTFGAGPYAHPIWSPDGRYLCFGALGKGIYWARADAAGQPQPLTQNKNFQIPFSFSPDGKWLAYHEEGTDSAQIWTLPIAHQDGQLEAGKPVPFLKRQFGDATPAFSPDGRWLAYVSDESSEIELYVRAFPPPSSVQGDQWQISSTGGGLPVWSRAGRELIYKAGHSLMAVRYSVNGDSFVAEKPRPWIAKFDATQFDLAPDGKRVAALMPIENAEGAKHDHEVVFLENFVDELRRRAPLQE